MSDDDNKNPPPEDPAPQAFADAERKRGAAVYVAYDRERDPWRGKLLRNDKGKLTSDLANAMVLLEHHPAWQGVIALDEFAMEVVKLRQPPIAHMKAGKWLDHDTTLLRQWFSQAEGLKLDKNNAHDAVLAIATINGFNKVRQFIESLPPWDGTQRLETLIDDVFGTGQNEYFSHLGHHLVVTLIARVLDPGCQVDEMLVLEGPQGIGKTSCLRELVGGAPLHMSMRESPGHKDFYINLRGSWLVEIAEMQSFNKSDISAVKQAITDRYDKFRSPYDKWAREYPRQSIFAGSINGSMYLADPSGGRRFLPVPCTMANPEYIRLNRTQLFAEGLVRYREAWRWWEYPLEIARDLQESRFVQDAWENRILDFLEGKFDNPLAYEGVDVDAKGRVTQITLSELLLKACGVEVGRQDVSTQKRATAILQRIDWKQVRLAGGSRKRVYRRPATPDSPDGNQGAGV